MTPRQLPVPELPDLAGNVGPLLVVADRLLRYFRQLHTRLTNWTAETSDALQAQVFSQVLLTPAPTGATNVFRCPYTIETDAGGLPKALLCLSGPGRALGMILTATTDKAPPGGQWMLEESADWQTVVLGQSPPFNTILFFAFLVARRS